MKNKPFNKQVITLVIGLLMICSVQALALSSNSNQELTNTKAWGESELLIAQSPDSQALTPKEKNDLVAAVAASESCLSDLSQAGGILQAADTPQSQKDAIAMAFSQAKSIFGPALSQAAARAQTKGDARAIAQAFSTAQAVLGPAFAQLKVIANSPGSPGEDLVRVRLPGAESCFSRAFETILAIAR